MKITVNMRYRMIPEESIKSRHLELMNGLKKIAPPWGLKGVKDIPQEPIIKNGDVSTDSWLGIVIDGVSSWVHYLYRSHIGLYDEAFCDDCILIDISPDTINYKYFITEVLVKYIEIYRPYRVTLETYEETEEEFYCDKEERMMLHKKTGKNIDGRDTVYRIQAVNYWDDVMCKRAFGMDSDGIIKLLQGKYPVVKKILKGVFLIVSYELLTRDQTIQYDKEIRNLLGVISI